MLNILRGGLSSRLRSHLRGPYKRAQWLIERVKRAAYYGTLTDDQFASALTEVGISPGATVMIHSSMDVIHSSVPTINPIKLIQMLQHLLTEEGTLLMPTFPFEGLQINYLSKCDTFYPRRTPSQVGLMSEVFRRMPSVTRSLHPTHSVAGWGKHATDLLSTHHEGTAFGENSPFFKLQNFGGIVVGLGVRLNRGFTILHVAEELHPKAREFAFEKVPYKMSIIQKDQSIPYELYPLRADVRRNLRVIEKALLKDGTLRYTKKSGLPSSVTRADRFITRCQELIDTGSYFN
jgi:aminoglycoside 3-N-acetyltransferase